MNRHSVRSPPPIVKELPAASYAYLLGLYRGDGWIVAMARETFSLRISLDQRYPGIIARAAVAVAEVNPRSVVRVWDRIGCSVVASCWKHWPAVFPQHAPGRKHERRIAPARWQREITAVHSRELLRGLIHSDGCRFVANQRVGGKTYRYPRCSFSNRSEDIKAIFCHHLDLLGIRWTRPNGSDIAIDRRAEVAKLDAFVGPKR